MSTFNFGQVALKEMIPTECWAIYQVDANYHIERAKVDSKGRIMDYRPLGPAAARRIGRALLNDKKDKQFSFKGCMDEVMFINLQGNSMTAIWHRPRQQWKFHYAQGMHIKDGERWMPGLVFRVTNGNIYIWAYRHSEWFGMHTTLYHAPIHNMYSDGRLCISLESKWLDTDTWETWRNRMETQVFGTKKSEIHLDEYKTKEQDLMKLHRMLPDMKEFPEDWLIKTEKKLKPDSNESR